MFRSFRLLRRAGYGTASVLGILILAYWIWGSSAWLHLSAISDGVGEKIRESEPIDARLRAVDKRLDKANEDTSELAQLIAKLDTEIESLDFEVKTLEIAQQQDEVLLGHLQQHLSQLRPGETVSINGKKFARHKLARDAELILDRHAGRDQQITDLQTHRGRQAELREGLSKGLHDRLRRTQIVELDQERARRLSDQQKFNESLPDLVSGRGGDDNLAAAEQEQAEVLSELTSQAAAAEVISQAQRGGHTPAADAIQVESGPSIEDRIEKALNGHRLAAGE